MLRNIAIFIALIGLGILLWLWQPWKSNKPEPHFLNRLPNSSVIGKANILRIADQLHPMFYYYKLPSRDFMSQEFFLRQAKTYGLDIQKPVYFFGELDSITIHQNDWGALVNVSDSSKLQQGIDYLNIFLDIKVEKIEKYRIFNIPKINLSFVYGNDWFLLSTPEKVKFYFNTVASAELGAIPTEWKQFLGRDSSSNEAFSAQIKTQQLSKLGFAQFNLTLENDSSHLIGNGQLTAKNKFPFEFATITNGLAQEEFTKNFGNIHIKNIDKEALSEQLYYRYLEKQAQKINFPLKDFLDAWTGFLSFRQGGWHVIPEKYVESEYDENFNYVEVVKYKSTKVKGLSCFMSTNEKFNGFRSRLIAKGILTKQERKNYFLFSPPLNEQISDSTAIYYTNRYTPIFSDSISQGGMFTNNRVPYQITLDSLNGKKLYGTFQFPLEKWVKN